MARLRHDSLLSREIGASYIERNWPATLKDSGTWPLASLKAAFFQGYFTRLEKADDALRQTISRAVSQSRLLGRQLLQMHLEFRRHGRSRRRLVLARWKRIHPWFSLVLLDTRDKLTPQIKLTNAVPTARRSARSGTSLCKNNGCQ